MLYIIRLKFIGAINDGIHVNRLKFIGVINYVIYKYIKIDRCY